jgi:hypothetical protein
MSNRAVEHSRTVARLICHNKTNAASRAALSRATVARVPYGCGQGAKISSQLVVLHTHNAPPIARRELIRSVRGIRLAVNGDENRGAALGYEAKSYLGYAG